MAPNSWNRATPPLPPEKKEMMPTLIAFPMIKAPRLPQNRELRIVAASWLGSEPRIRIRKKHLELASWLDLYFCCTFNLCWETNAKKNCRGYELFG
jgi:hypothetical protein